jgi:hypothetical protein
MTIPNAVYDAGGTKVALRYLQPIQKYIRLGNKHEYVFTPRFSVSLAWVDEEDVNAILNSPKPSGQCCGGAGRTNGFILASQSMINCHTNGGR